MLLEALVCGHTEISSSCLVEEIEMLQQMNSETDKTGFCTQFDVSNINCCLTQVLLNGLCYLVIYSY